LSHFTRNVTDEHGRPVPAEITDPARLAIREERRRLLDAQAEHLLGRSAGILHDRAGEEEEELLRVEIAPDRLTIVHRLPMLFVAVL